MNEAVRRAICLTGVGRVIVHRRVVVSKSLSRFSLYDAHFAPIAEMI